MGEFAPLPTIPGKLNFPLGIDPNSSSEILNYLDELDHVEHNASVDPAAAD